MAFTIADRVWETSTTTGTGALTLAGAVSGYQTFSNALSNGDTCWYTIALAAEWEVGTGTYNANTLTRTTVIASTNSNAAVNFGAGSKDVFIDLPASIATQLKTLTADLAAKLALAGGTLTGALNWATAVTVVSATTPDIGGAASNLITMSGTTQVDGFATFAAGAMRWIKHTGAHQLTNSATLILVGGVTLTTAAGDISLFVSEGGGTWRQYMFSRATTPVTGAAFGGTGIANNAASTQTITGAFGITWTVAATTSLTLPASGVVLTLGTTPAATVYTSNNFGAL